MGKKDKDTRKPVHSTGGKLHKERETASVKSLDTFTDAFELAMMGREVTRRKRAMYLTTTAHAQALAASGKVEIMGDFA